jgi:hypothetical protein
VAIPPRLCLVHCSLHQARQGKSPRKARQPWERCNEFTFRKALGRIDEKSPRRSQAPMGV